LAASICERWAAQRSQMLAAKRVRNMHTEILVVDPLSPQPERIARAANVLRRGGLVAFPTETVYGLGANALDPDAVAGIFRAKGRPPNNPVIVHVAEPAEARQIVADWPDIAERLARRFWPGPLTLVLPKRDVVPDIVTAGGPTVAVRVPAHPVALALVRAAGVPIAAPSANRSTQLSPTRADHVLDAFVDQIDFLLDGGPTPGGLESTVLDLTTTPPRLLRPGLITPTDLETLIGPIGRIGPMCGAESLPSPGMMSRHYAPRTPLECVEGDAKPRVKELVAAGERAAWVGRGPDESASEGLFRFEMPSSPKEYAALLYAALHLLDNPWFFTRIVVELPPDTPEWLAVRDRLRRASSR
jgi:L-threonylcarbamoyladenylate synthase